MRDWEAYLREQLDLPTLKAHRDDRMIRELADHLKDTFDEALIRGATEEEADALALRELGDAGVAMRELVRTEPSHVTERADRWMEAGEERLRGRGDRWAPVADLGRDVRVAIRGLRKRPMFSGVVVMVLAIGIGATTAIFTLVNAIVLSPLPFEDQGRLVAVSHSAPTRGIEDAGQCAAWHFVYEDENRVFESVGMYGSASVAVLGAGDPEAVPALYVTSGVLRALSLTPVLGRTFTLDDEDVNADPTVLLSERYWRTRFGSDPDVAGRTIEVDGSTRQIVGVVPEALRSLGQDGELILPLRFDKSTLFVGNIGYGAVARLRPGVTTQEAASDLQQLLPRAWERFPGGPVASSSDPSQYLAVVTPLRDELVGSFAAVLWTLLAGVGVVLLIACANVANLFLVRSEGRHGEMAVRMAMGASTRRIRAEYVKESLVLGLVGGLAGLGLARLGLRALIAAAPSELPRLQEVSISPAVLFVTLGISVGTGVAFGLIPTLRRRNSGPAVTLREGRAGGRRGGAAQNVLAVGQMALALVLIVASGLMLRSFQALRDVDPGFRAPESVQALRLSIPGSEEPDGEVAARTFETIARRLEEVPGVDAVGMATAIPMDGGNNVNPFHVDGASLRPEGPPVSRRHKWVGAGFFGVMRIPVRAGRVFTPDEVEARFPGAILSESLAREYWGSAEAAIGQRVAARPEPARWHEVVGVVADVRDDGVDQEGLAMVYWPQVTLGFWEGTSTAQVQVWRSMGYAVRSDRVGTARFTDELRAAIWEVSPNLPVRGLVPLTDLMAGSIATTSFLMVLLGVAGGVALLLGMIGVYGVISYSVSQQTRALGMRIVLGARTADVRKLVLRQGLLISLGGVGLGLGLCLGLTWVMSDLLYGVSPTDPATMGVVAVVLTLVALAASYVPARRASSVDPLQALRAD